MEYVKLILGLLVLIAFTWILIRNAKRSGFLHSWIRVDTVIGIMAGLYIVFASLRAIIQ